jgi:hypothetical protein
MIDSGAAFAPVEVFLGFRSRVHSQKSMLSRFRKELVRGTRAYSVSNCRALIEAWPSLGPRKFVPDTNCFVDASRGDAEAPALAEFSAP